jgi:hypothetical protein
MFDAGNPQDVADTVEILKWRHPVGHFVLKMDEDKSKTFRLRTVPSFTPGVEGGGATAISQRNGDQMVVGSLLNLDNAKKTAAKLGLTTDFLQLVAHELGHAWYLAYVNPESQRGDVRNDAMAVAWENAVREENQQRTRH